jgi:hypothetical protein
MAVNKAKRSNPSAQPQRRRLNHQPRHSQPRRSQIKDSPVLVKDPQRKAQLFETLRHMNRGYGVVVAAFDRLQKQDRIHKMGIFPVDSLRDYRDRTEALCAAANRDLLRLFAGREELEAERLETPTRPS